MSRKGYNTLPSFKSASHRVRNRDGGKCVVCKSKEDLTCHHLNHERYDNRDENLITLCEPCHILVHKWIKRDPYVPCPQCSSNMTPMFNVVEGRRTREYKCNDCYTAWKWKDGVMVMISQSNTMANALQSILSS